MNTIGSFCTKWGQLPFKCATCVVCPWGKFVSQPQSQCANRRGLLILLQTVSNVDTPARCRYSHQHSSVLVRCSAQQHSECNRCPFDYNNSLLVMNYIKKSCYYFWSICIIRNSNWAPFVDATVPLDCSSVQVQEVHFSQLQSVWTLRNKNVFSSATWSAFSRVSIYYNNLRDGWRTRVPLTIMSVPHLRPLLKPVTLIECMSNLWGRTWNPWN